MMFSISELSFASCKERVFIKIVSFGIVQETHFNSASAALEAASCFNIFFVSRSIARAQAWRWWTPGS
jgi:hypothetical protein